MQNRYQERFADVDLLQVAQILGPEHVIWTNNGIAPISEHSAKGGDSSSHDHEPANLLMQICELNVQYHHESPE